ncbi:MAG TPA: class I SAM-dependent methyltransferase [Streptosporangiaceae bacterium]
MNPDHEKLCGSQEWAADLRAQILPVVTAGVSLGKDMLEIGPGPGAATAWLLERVAHLTVLEADEAAARRLVTRYADSNVTVDIGDAMQMPYDDESFDSVGSFTMLHHVPTAAAQHQILAEALRVLRPGGWLAGSDSLASNDLHCFHHDDTYNPAEPSTLLVWLRALGFTPITITVGDELMFTACKPAREASLS